MKVSSKEKKQQQRVIFIECTRYADSPTLSLEEIFNIVIVAVVEKRVGHTHAHFRHS